MEHIGMDACVECGSIRIRVISGGLVQRVLALLLNQRVVVCGRCGWRGRLRGRRGGAATTPRTRASAGHRSPSTGAATERGVDLDAIDRALGHDATRGPARPGEQ